MDSWTRFWNGAIWWEINFPLNTDGNTGVAMIYFLQDSLTCDIKIGFAKNDAEARQKVLQTGNPRTLVQLLVIDGDRTVEAELHAQFATSRGLGEWFRPTPDILQYIVIRAIRDGHESGFKAGRELSEERISLAVIEAVNDACESCDFPASVEYHNARRREEDFDEWFNNQPAMCGPNTPPDGATP